MICKLTKTKLVRLLRAVAKGEQEIEKVRQILVKNPEFESYTAFKRIDRNLSNTLSATDIETFLRDNRIRPSEKDLLNFLNVYGGKSGLRMTYIDFQKLVLPRANELLRFKCLGRKVQAISREEYLPKDIERSLAEFIQIEMNFLQKIELLKEDLSIRHDFGLMEAFMTIDQAKKMSLNFNALLDFLNNNGGATEKDIAALLARFDKNKDQELSYSEFAELLQPVNPNYRVTLKSCSPERKSRVTSPKLAEKEYLKTEPVFTPVKEKKNLDETSERNYREVVLETAKSSGNASRISRRNKSFGSTGSSALKGTPTKDKILEASPLSSPLTSPLKFSNVSALKNLSTIKSMSIYSYDSPTADKGKETKSPKILGNETKSPKILNEKAEGFDSLNADEKKELAKFLKSELDLEKSLDDIKRELTGQKDFSSFGVFRLFDTKVKGYITKEQLEFGLNQLNVFPTKNELSLLMRKFDKDDDGFIRYSDFKAEIDARENSHKGLLGYEQKDEEVNQSTRALLRKLLNQMISNESDCEHLRRSLERKLHFAEAFRNLKQNTTRWITAKAFKDLLNNQGIFVSAEDTVFLLNKYDRTNFGKVSYSGFAEQILQKL